MSDHSGAKPRGGILTWALWGAALIGVAAVVYIIAQASIKPEQDPGLRAVAHGAMSKLETPQQASLAPRDVFYDAAGQPHRAADFKGRVLVLNLWATWCAPCVAEMPTLAKLATEYADKPVTVIPVSIDTPEALDKAKAFIGQHPPLAFYNDANKKLPFSLKPPASGLPTTIIYGADGLERGRVAGGADWSGADARAVVDHVLAQR
jgi:thiol-disulfide isomerase/thioredoxin